MTVRRALTGLLLAGAILGAGLLVACGDELPGGAVAKVGQTLISKDSFNQLMSLYQAKGRVPDKEHQPKQYQAFECNVTEYLVVMEILRQEAPAYKVAVTDEDVQQEINQLKQMFQGDEKQFAEALKKQNMTLEQLTWAVRDRLLYDRMKEAVTKGVSVTDDEVKAYYDSHKEDYTQPETREVRHILISPVQPGVPVSEATQADWEAAQAEAEKVRSEILNGADFASEALKYSDDASTRESGGELGAITRGQMVPAFEEAVFSLRKGEVSQPVKTQYGYHLIQVTDINPPKQMSFEQVKEAIKSSLLTQKETQVWEGWLAEKKAELGVVYRSGLEPISTTSTTAPRGSGTASTAQ